ETRGGSSCSFSLADPEANKRQPTVEFSKKLLRGRMYTGNLTSHGRRLRLTGTGSETHVPHLKASVPHQCAVRVPV
ncbi:hypothetical protein, partial [Macromonas nakdongensis]|uniref:hypothetical protein n=1 Tax=Macromonas nakdongensis TaxID=1843082 RepID=UPI001E49D185